MGEEEDGQKGEKEDIRGRMRGEVDMESKRDTLVDWEGVHAHVLEVLRDGSKV